MISKGLLGVWSYYFSLSTAFQVPLFKYWHPYVSPGCTIQLTFWVFLLCFNILMLTLPLSVLGSMSTFFALGSLYVGQGGTISIWISFLDSLFFSGFWHSEILNVPRVLQE